MLLNDIYDQLAYGELRQVVLGSGDIDSVVVGLPPENCRRLLPFVKAGLTELHKRFALRESEFVVELQPNKVSYHLTPDFAQSNGASTEPTKYISDADEAFVNNLMRVERVYGTYQAKEFPVPLNALLNGAAARTPRYDTLVIPSDTVKAPWLLETTSLRVVFRADHPPIDDATANASPGTTPIYLSSTYLEAMTFYIASRASNPNGASETFHDGNNYAAKFEQAVLQLKEYNFDLDEDEGHTKFADRGWA